jgi:hypothetical protein
MICLKVVFVFVRDSRLAGWGIGNFDGLEREILTVWKGKF